MGCQKYKVVELWYSTDVDMRVDCCVDGPSARLAYLKHVTWKEDNVPSTHGFIFSLDYCATVASTRYSSGWRYLTLFCQVRVPCQGDGDMASLLWRFLLKWPVALPLYWHCSN